MPICRNWSRRVGEARKGYVSYVKEGIALGRRPELVGGGLIRSLGGWDEVKKMRRSGQDRIKSDQRILPGFGISKLTNRRNMAPVGLFPDLSKIGMCLHL
jgi:hypothetical protein